MRKRQRKKIVRKMIRGEKVSKNKKDNACKSWLKAYMAVSPCPDESFGVFWEITINNLYAALQIPRDI